MFFIKPTFVFLAILFASHVRSTDPPNTGDPSLDAILAAAALPLRTDFSDPNTHANSSLEAGATATTCVEKGSAMRDKYRPPYTDCAKALRLFPSTSDVKEFCNTPSTSCRLPASGTNGKCSIIVHLVRSNREMTSWAEIGLAAMQLMAACQADGKTAGSTLAGPNDAIQISISKIRE